MEILVKNNTKKRTPETIQAKIQTILNALDCHDSELSVVFVDNDEITDINFSFRGKNKPTNVLSFPMHEGEFGDLNPELLGDVVISLETAQDEANKAHIKFEERLSQLLIHGILHLLGYDHERSEEDANIMEKKSVEILRLVEKNINLDFF
ncbi:MAG: rRNA maturation RNase YbeY [Desulfobacterales bacterium]|nr:rRNA maturation RNase YbeY [Desulfobacterales bacterium]MCP4159966.1 rRNA maturation RNase YbeY [Deltaproteobacteria bacterium]